MKKNRQVGNAKTKFLSEPDMCVEIKSLKKEYQEYGKEEITYKPVDIYLKHCQEYANTNLKDAQIEVEGYQFRRQDFIQQQISIKFIEQLQNDQNTCDILDLKDDEIATFF